MYLSIYAMDTNTPVPPARKQPVNRVNLVSEMRREKREREERQARLDAEDTARREQERRIVAEAKALAEAIIAEAKEQAAVITVQAVEEVEARPRLVHDIISAVAEEYGVTVAEIKGLRREKYIVPARQEAMARVYRERPDLSLTVLGRLFHRDHTTVLSAIKKMGVWRKPGSGKHPVKGPHEAR